MVERAGTEAKLGFKAHPHMLRHATCYALASKGHDTRTLQAYLGHKNIQHTVRYTELSPTRSRISGASKRSGEGRYTPESGHAFATAANAALGRKRHFAPQQS